MPIPLQGRRHTMLVARGHAIESYSVLEQSLCALFTGLAKVERDVGGLIFFRIINTNSRLAILEGLFKKRFGKQFNLFRNSIKTHVRSLDGMRNNIIHWSAVSVYTGDNVTLGDDPDIMKLAPPNHWWKSEDRTEVTLDQIFVFSDKCLAVSRFINMFYIHFVEEIESITDAEREPWREIFSQPLPYPIPEDHPLYAPPSRRQNPPQS